MKAFRDKLEVRRVALMGQMMQAEMHSRERDLEATQDPADMAANAYNKELLVSMSVNDRNLIDMIDEALVRMDDEEYGICQNCEQVIPEKRLDALPWARYCVRCQDLMEKGLLRDDED